MSFELPVNSKLEWCSEAHKGSVRTVNVSRLTEEVYVGFNRGYCRCILRWENIHEYDIGFRLVEHA